MFKVIQRINKLSTFEALDILSTTVADLAAKDPEQHLTTEQHARVTMCMRFIKTVQQAILLQVNLAKRTPGPKTDLKTQEERAYTSLIEEVCKHALKTKSLYLLKLLP